jgi:hypothetical protein
LREAVFLVLGYKVLRILLPLLARHHIKPMQKTQSQRVSWARKEYLSRWIYA